MTDLGESIISALQEAVAYGRGEDVDARVTQIAVPDRIDVQAVRQTLKMSQADFAEQFGFSLSSIRNWEQGRRRPGRKDRVLLTLIRDHPQTVLSTLALDGHD